jgi:cytochrome oxidase Cu insertion factor (SCO1/SenC/PrrC family)
MGLPAAVTTLVLVLLAAVPVAGATLDDLLGGLNLVALHGAAPPPLALERVADGKKVALAELRGRPVVVYFWATW